MTAPMTSEDAAIAPHGRFEGDHVAGALGRIRSSGAIPAAMSDGTQPALTGSGWRMPASDARSAALSVRSHGRSRSGRPKWPYAAVWR